MRHYLGKTGIILLLGTTAIALTGCFDLMSDQVEESTAGASNPGSDTGNNPPTISGNPPPAVVVGENYSFTPTASDPDGDTLTFSIKNKPSWADFDSATGSLSGIATLGTEGTYANIQITVSDGSLSASTSQFSVDVTQVALGSVTLSWTPPTQNEDGTALNDLAGYGVYYGTQQGNYDRSIRIDNPGIATYVVENLTPNTYYFASTAINSAGVESGFSNEAAIVVN